MNAQEIIHEHCRQAGISHLERDAILGGAKGIRAAAIRRAWIYILRRACDPAPCYASLVAIVGIRDQTTAAHGDAAMRDLVARARGGDGDAAVQVDALRLDLAGALRLDPDALGHGPGQPRQYARELQARQRGGDSARGRARAPGALPAAVAAGDRAGAGVPEPRERVEHAQDPDVALAAAMADRFHSFDDATPQRVEWHDLDEDDRAQWLHLAIMARRIVNEQRAAG